MCVCDPVEQHGHHYSSWAAKYFLDCLYSNSDYISFFLGWMSILAWMCAQFPQIYKNHKNRTAESLSKWFLVEWFLGDATNLVGCIFTHQLPTQLYTAIYFCTMDVVLLSQWFYLTRMNERQGWKKAMYSRKIIEAHDGEGWSRESGSGLRNLASNRNLHAIAIICTLSLAIGSRSGFGGMLEPSGPPDYSTGRALLDTGTCGNADDVASWERNFGSALGWVSAVCYLLSRMPQIYRNWKRRTCDGLSPIMFSCAVLGNATYGASIFLRSLSWSYIWPRLAWIIGSVGTMSFDFFILVQFALYRHKGVSAPAPEEKPLLNPAAHV